jgi:signal transduction histidine kinase
LLDLSRITSGKVELDIEAVDLHETLRHVCGSCHSQMHERGIRLETELYDGTALIAADSAWLQQVLWNVLINAIKFSPENGTIRVTTARQAGGRWEVRVQDNGIGISVEALPRIFDAFEQGGVKVTRQFGGLGLGLAIPSPSSNCIGALFARRAPVWVRAPHSSSNCPEQRPIRSAKHRTSHPQKTESSQKCGFCLSKIITTQRALLAGSCALLDLQ